MKRSLAILLYIVSIMPFCAFPVEKSPAGQPDAMRISTTDIGNASTEALLDHAKRLTDLGLFTEKAEILEILARGDRRLTEKQKLVVYFGLAHCYYAMGNYQSSLKNLYQVLLTEKSDENMFYDIAARIMLADIYIRFNSIEKGENVMIEAERLANAYAGPKEKKDDLLQRLHQQWATIHAAKKEWPDFFESLRKTDAYGVHTEVDKRRRLLDYGIYYTQTGKPRIAEQYYQKIIAETQWSYDRMAAICNYAQLLFSTGDFARSREISDMGIEQIKGHPMDDMHADLLKTKALALSRLGHPDQAVPLLQRSMQIKDSIFNWHTSHSVLLQANEYEKALLDSENRKNADDARKNRLITIALIVTVLVLALSIYLMYRRIRKSHRLRKELDARIEAQEVAHTNEIRETLSDLSEKNRHLSALTLKMAQVNDLIKKAVDDKETDIPAEKRLENLRANMKTIDLNRNVWEIFDIIFQQTNPAFFHELYRRHPDLTKGETRMCAYTLMNLSTKEIAIITNRSMRTVETIRYRLGKKLNLDHGSSLSAYLHSLIQ